MPTEPRLVAVWWIYAAAGDLGLSVSFSLVAASRPILGLHCPSDVIAGALLGAGVAQATLLFSEGLPI